MEILRSGRWAMVAENELLERAQAGEEGAFADLVRPHERRLRALARGLVHNEQDAEDLTQEALLRIYRALPYFQRQASFATWASRILTRVCLDHLRQGRRRPLTESLAEEERQEPPAPGPGPEEMALQVELRANLRAALAALPLEQRTVLILHDVCSFKYREIAAISGCSVGTVKSRLFTARLRFRQLFAGVHPEGGRNDGG